MTVGGRTHRLMLRKPAGAIGYSDVVEVWGAVQMAGRGAPEQLQAGAPATIAPWVIEIGFRSDVRAEWQIYETLTGRTWQVSSYGDPDDRQRDLLLFCAEVQ
jgi:head-tail adaptor